ncbi:hypothetical protein HUG10_19195 (plasmid) [Halorarum halophilum]|uniref:Uncharacterized protein n=1 Tax=Halorarum halophilum TaxID=2743090 RepID=A0A7D5H3H7_9EURY|nr:hypothetical protein [Halobaculum halophilum]QLG29733.1 hypothetical protein HUG10_19195 [Halobaculum halophilum]
MTDSPTADETTPAATDSPTGTATGDGHGHSHGNETEGENGSSTNGTDGANGKLTVVVAGNEVPLQEQSQSEGSSFYIDEDDPHTWHGSTSGQTLAEALSTLGIDAGPQELSYDGETYTESTEGTGIYVRVNGEEVDPTQYELSDGDEIWVTVETADMDVETPGEYIKADQQHIHGPITFEVEGEELDFSEDRYQTNHQLFHFEGGHAEPWHAHSWSMTLEWAMNSLDGINVTENSVTYDGTTYDGSDSDTTVTIEVNGESVDPSEYYLKDGDNVNIVVETE